MKLLLSTTTLLLLTGCGISTFTQRETDPFIRDYFFNMRNEPMAIMITDSSRRLIYQFKTPDPNRKIYCSDPSPDTSIAAYGSITGDMQMIVKGVPAADGSNKFKFDRNSQTSTLPLLRRSQGLQWGRDKAALECILYGTGVINEPTYLQRLDTIRDKEVELIKEEIKAGLGQLGVGTTPVTVNTHGTAESRPAE